MSDLAQKVLDGISAKRLAAAQLDQKVKAEIAAFEATFAPLMEALRLLGAAQVGNLVTAAALAARLAKIPAAHLVERQAAAQAIGHLAHQRKALGARAAYLAAEAARVAGGGTSYAMVGTTSADLSQFRTIMPVRDRAASF